MLTTQNTDGIKFIPDHPIYCHLASLDSMQKWAYLKSPTEDIIEHSLHLLNAHYMPSIMISVGNTGRSRLTQILISRSLYLFIDMWPMRRWLSGLSSVSGAPKDLPHVYNRLEDYRNETTCPNSLSFVQKKGNAMKNLTCHARKLEQNQKKYNFFYVE